MTPLIPALAGALIVAGLIGVVVGLRRRQPRHRPPAPPRRLPGCITRMTARTRMLLLGRRWRWACRRWLITGWVLAVVIAAGGRRSACRSCCPLPGGHQIDTARSDGGVDPVACPACLTVGIGLEQALVRRCAPHPRRSPRGQRDWWPGSGARWDTEDAPAGIRRRARRRHRGPDRRQPDPRRPRPRRRAAPTSSKASPSRSPPTCGRAGRSRPTGPSRDPPLEGDRDHARRPVACSRYGHLRRAVRQAARPGDPRSSCSRRTSRR